MRQLSKEAKKLRQDDIDFLKAHALEKGVHQFNDAYLARLYEIITGKQLTPPKPHKIVIRISENTVNVVRTDPVLAALVEIICMDDDLYEYPAHKEQQLLHGTVDVPFNEAGSLVRDS